MNKKIIITANILLLVSVISSAQVINEIVVNPNGGDDNCEYIEIKGSVTTSLIDHYFVSLEGDSTSSLGAADFVYDLSAATMGLNGLLVITADDLTGVCGTRTWGAPDTTVVRDSDLDGGRLENGSNSWLLISSPMPIIEGTDYDGDNDGVLELPAGATIVDGVAWLDGGMGDINYGSVSLPSTAGGTNDMATRFPSNQMANDTIAWYHGDMSGGTESLDYDLMQASGNFPVGGMLTPGEENVPVDLIFENGFESLAF